MNLLMLEIDKKVCRDLELSGSREWLETNGIGGYASGTVAGAHTRRYHGLLVAATNPPLGRMLLLSKFEETLILDGERFELSTNQYPGEIHPEGYKYLTGFRLEPFPIWTYEVNGVELEKSVFMPHGENTVVCQWKLTDSALRTPNSALELRPLLAFRDHHHLRHEDAQFNGDYAVDDGIITVQPYQNMRPLNFAHNASAIEHQGHWYRHLEYAIERERGFDFTEDLFQPFCLTFDLASDAAVIASTDARKVTDASELEKAQIKRRADLIVRAETDDESLWPLILAADQFIVTRGGGKTVIAGYPWFSDWGRDTMIALPGLTLATKRPEIARSIILEFAKHISKGMIPNRFPDEGETPDYNTVDATLWFFEAIRAYADATGDYEMIRIELYEKLVGIIDHHVAGTRYNIHVDSDGLLYAGEPGTQLTWMDAKIGDWVVTPRIGKPVEIQALWHNALCIMESLAERFGDAERQTRYFEMAAVARDSFNGQFWNDAESCLYDVINGNEKDGSVRPHQIFAVSLTHSMLDAKRARAVVKKVEGELLTPVGLRSLSPKDPRYVRVYIGSPHDRDAAYHQGTAWGWLIGHFVDAYRKVHSKDVRAKKRIDEILTGLREHLSAAAVGQVSEIFDGEPPHTPRGCPAQAWSVAELLRVLTK
ncbi:MAG: glycogen debranching enzyme family protein [Pyrinomonadaceae bacterium]|nr:glycogen debranching enzyme family protein [Pyrinomonadaceae bacterium]